jgi:hypothetical protein
MIGERRSTMRPSKPTDTDADANNMSALQSVGKGHGLATIQDNCMLTLRYRDRPSEPPDRNAAQEHRILRKAHSETGVRPNKPQFDFEEYKRVP